MGEDAAPANTALAGSLYTTLGWQLLLLAVVTLAIAWPLWWRRSRTGEASDAAVEPTGRRVLRIGLGSLWLMAGLLQAQPAMPSSFVAQTITPGLQEAPDWLYALVDPFTRIWVQHPVGADAVTVWIQVGLGIALLVGGHGRGARLALWCSIAWAGFVWVIGELLGGLTDPTASWLNGAPGAALLYVAGSAILLLPLAVWTSGLAGRLVRILVGATLLAGAVLQALPRAGYWEPAGLSSVLSGAAAGGMPGVAAAPVQWLAAALPAHAVAAEALLVLTLLVLGAGLVLGVLPRTMCVAAAVLCLLGWWVGEGFGVFGGTGTDPDTGAVLLVLLAAAWPWPAATDPDPSTVRDAGAFVPASAPASRRVIGVALALAALLVLPLVAGTALLQPQSAQAAIGDSGGMVLTTPTAAPDFTLTDQHGRKVAMRDTRGKLTVVVFLDPECFEDCPLMANQLATAVRSLGAAGSSVAIMAVDVNPSFNSVQDVRTFTTEHGLGDLAGWHFVTGTNDEVGAVLAAFGGGVTVPAVGMIGHPDGVYLFGRDGRQLAVLNDTANDDLTESYAQLIASELRRHL